MSDADKTSGPNARIRGARKATILEGAAVDSRILDESNGTAAVAPPAPDEAASEQAPASAMPETAEAVSVDPQPAPQKQRSLAIPMLIAALLGGGVATMGGELINRMLPTSPRPSMAEVTALKVQIAELQQRPAPTAPNLSPLAAKLNELEQSLARIASTSPGAASAPDPTLASRLAGLEADILTLRNSKAGEIPSLDPLNTRLGALEQRLSQRAAEADPRVKALQDEVTALRRSTGLAFLAPTFGAIQALAGAFNQGQPFQAELEGAEALAGSSIDLAHLRPLAAKGAPTLQRIASDFRPLSEQAARLASSSTPSMIQSYLERFIKVRPVGTPGGNSPIDLIATMDAHVQRGAVSEALAVASRLPEPIRATLSPWLQTAEQRQKAAAALATAQQSVLTALKAQRP
jgi:hypothetical protein